LKKLLNHQQPLLDTTNTTTSRVSGRPKVQSQHFFKQHSPPRDDCPTTAVQGSYLPLILGV
jgi:hypothetical protein